MKKLYKRYHQFDYICHSEFMKKHYIQTLIMPAFSLRAHYKLLFSTHHRFWLNCSLISVLSFLFESSAYVSFFNAGLKFENLELILRCIIHKLPNLSLSSQESMEFFEGFCGYQCSTDIEIQMKNHQSSFILKDTKMVLSHCIESYTKFLKIRITLLLRQMSIISFNFLALINISFFILKAITDYFNVLFLATVKLTITRRVYIE